MRALFLTVLCTASLYCADLSYCADLRPPPTQWVEDLGGSVTRNSQGRIIAVDLRGTWVGDSDLRNLNELPDLTKLDLSLTHISDQGMQEIKDLKGITDLSLYFAEYVTDEGIAAIKGWKKLKILNLHGTKVGDTGLEHIAGISTLESLNVGSTLMTDVGLERLTNLTNLKQLTMGGNELGDAGLQALRQLPGLTYLDLSGRQGTDKNVWTIAMSDAGLNAVLTLKQLKELHFGCSFIGVGIEGQRLGEVSLLSVTPQWLDRMRALPALEKLHVQGCNRINDEAVSLLTGMPALKEVDLQGTSVTEKGAAALKSAKPSTIVFYGPWSGKSANYRNN
jgi:internalin A